MHIVLRLLFALAVIVISILGSVFLGTVINRDRDNEHRSVTKTTAIVIEAIAIGVFFTLLCVEKGII